jgi:hypothetical protein
MRAPSGFSITKRLASSDRSEVYVALREADARGVVLKASTEVHGAGGSDLAREFEALRAVQGPGIVQAVDLLPDDGPVLVLERVDGIDLASWSSAGAPAIGAVLDVAVGIAAALERVHAARWIHCDIAPTNALVEPRTRETWLIDFGLAQRLGAQASSVEAARVGGGTPLYRSPEQTGRMNRGVDPRSDLYSFGATLYSLFTGGPPFPLEDTLALLHAHMALLPRAPAELRPEMGATLSRLVLKLLAKDPADRYQSARSLLADLRACREQLARHGRIDETFSLGTAEVPDRPRFSAALYDRDAEIALLGELFARARAGALQIAAIAGEPGSGKSALAERLRPQLAESAGYLAVGKFDLSCERPYGVWASALGHFAQQLLVASDAHVGRWRALLRTALGSIAGALVELVPDLRFVLGDVEALPVLGAPETEARLGLALQRFVATCATREHPLVLFLDDLQWADAASRELLEDLAVHVPGVSLLLIVAYRSNEIGPEHPLLACFRRLEAHRIGLATIHLRPLSSDGALRMLADVLERPSEHVRPLAALVERKTGNAPLFLRQFVEHVHGEGLLRYEIGVGWTYDLAVIASASVPEGAAALMAARLHRLEPAVRAVIELAGCVGDEFDLQLLSQLTRLEAASIERGLYALCDEGLIAPCARGFRFVHDRIREAAIQLLAEEPRAKLHYEIARLLLERVSAEERPKRLFEIAEHLNAGLTQLVAAHRIEAVELNLAAGQRALGAGAAALAEKFLQVARQLFQPEDWSKQRALGFGVFLRSVESALLRGDYASALALADVLEHRNLSPLEFAQIAARRIQVLALTRRAEDCAAYALGVLRRLGVRWPLRAGRWRAGLALRIAQWRLRGRRVERALRPARTVDARWAAPIVVIGAFGTIGGRVNHSWSSLAAAWVVSSNLRHGYLERPAYTLAGLACCVQLNRWDALDAERLAQVALARLQQVPEPAHAPRARMFIELTRAWYTPRRQAIAPLRQTAEALLEVGDRESAYYAGFLRTFLGALAGDPVDEVTKNLRELAEVVRRGGVGYWEPENCLGPYGMLEAGAQPGCDLRAELARSEAEVAARDQSGETFARTLWMMVLAVHRRWELVFAQGEIMADRLFINIPHVQVVDHTFYRGMAAAELARTARGASRRRYLRVLRHTRGRMQRWSKAGPDFAHMALLLEAERARLAGGVTRARALYEKGARMARQQQFPNHAALAHERCAQMWQERRRSAEAALALAQASECYSAWGVASKSRALEAEVAALRARSGAAAERG